MRLLDYLPLHFTFFHILSKFWLVFEFYLIKYTIKFPKFFWLKPFLANGPILYPLKTPENLVFWCFQGVKNGNIGQKWVN